MTEPYMNESFYMNAGSKRVDEMTERTEAHLAELEQVRRDTSRTEEYRRAKTKEMRDAHAAYVRATLASARESFAEAERLAAKRLAPSAERGHGVVTRVARVLDAKGPARALEAFADDPDGLRELRDQLPSWVAAQDMSPGDGSRQTEAMRLAVDRALRPHARSGEATAIDVRLKLDDERARLDTTANWATSPNPTTALARYFASTPIPTATAATDHPGAA